MWPSRLEPHVAMLAVGVLVTVQFSEACFLAHNKTSVFARMTRDQPWIWRFPGVPNHCLCRCSIPLARCKPFWMPRSTQRRFVDLLCSSPWFGLVAFFFQEDFRLCHLLCQPPKPYRLWQQSKLDLRCTFRYPFLGVRRICRSTCVAFLAVRTETITQKCFSVLHRGCRVSVFLCFLVFVIFTKVFKMFQVWLTVFDVLDSFRKFFSCFQWFQGVVPGFRRVREMGEVWRVLGGGLQTFFDEVRKFFGCFSWFYWLFWGLGMCVLFLFLRCALGGVSFLNQVFLVFFFDCFLTWMFCFVFVCWRCCEVVFLFLFFLIVF